MFFLRHVDEDIGGVVAPPTLGLAKRAKGAQRGKPSIDGGGGNPVGKQEMLVLLHDMRRDETNQFRVRCRYWSVSGLDCQNSPAKKVTDVGTIVFLRFSRSAAFRKKSGKGKFQNILILREIRRDYVIGVGHISSKSIYNKLVKREMILLSSRKNICQKTGNLSLALGINGFHVFPHN